MQAALATLAPLAAVAAPLRILVFGDSLTAGWTSFGSGPTSPFSPALQAALGDRHLRSEITAAGQAGRRAAEGLQPLKRQLTAHKYDVVCILLGANDLYSSLNSGARLQEHTVSKLVADLNVLHSAVRAAGAVSISIGMLDHPFLSQQFPGVRAEINARLEADVRADNHIDAGRLLPSSQPVWSADSVHLQAEGYEELGRLLAAPLADAFAAKGFGKGILAHAPGPAGRHGATTHDGHG